MKPVSADRGVDGTGAERCSVEQWDEYFTHETAFLPQLLALCYISLMGSGEQPPNYTVTGMPIGRGNICKQRDNRPTFTFQKYSPPVAWDKQCKQFIPAKPLLKPGGTNWHMCLAFMAPPAPLLAGGGGGNPQKWETMSYAQHCGKKGVVFGVLPFLEMGS